MPLLLNLDVRCITSVTRLLNTNADLTTSVRRLLRDIDGTSTESRRLILPHTLLLIGCSRWSALTGALIANPTGPPYNLHFLVPSPGPLSFPSNHPLGRSGETPASSRVRGQSWTSSMAVVCVLFYGTPIFHDIALIPSYILRYSGGKIFTDTHLCAIFRS